LWAEGPVGPHEAAFGELARVELQSVFNRARDATDEGAREKRLDASSMRTFGPLSVM
jgi:hypothetical protein